jgi:hypothetical protein
MGYKNNLLFRSGQLVAGLFAIVLYSFPGSFLLQLLCSDIQTSFSQTPQAGILFQSHCFPFIVNLTCFTMCPFEWGSEDLISIDQNFCFTRSKFHLIESLL